MPRSEAAECSPQRCLCTRNRLMHNCACVLAASVMRSTRWYLVTPTEPWRPWRGEVVHQDEMQMPHRCLHTSSALSPGSSAGQSMIE